MAVYRLSVQTIQRDAGRSVVAASAYRAGVALADDRLGIAYDFSRKDGIEHREVMAPKGTPEGLRDREALWNAAEKADKRKDSAPAREILISLPHELNAQQRRELVRDFVQQSLVARGMIADVALHTPGKEGDQRNFHAHILVTTREVGPQGFGKKVPDWNGPKFIVDIRHEWARVQNLALQRHLGPDAPKVFAQSLADRGIYREPEPKMGPEATALQRRDEFSYRGAQRDRARHFNALDEEKTRGLRQTLRPETTAWIERPTRDLAREMSQIRVLMEGERDGFKARREAIATPRVPSVKQLENQLTAKAVIERRRAREALERAEAQAREQGLSVKQIALWVANPGAALMGLAKQEVNQIGRVLAARASLREAELALEARRIWARSDQGRAVIADVRGPFLDAATSAARERRTLERKIKRIDARIVRAGRVERNLEVVQVLKVSAIKVPGKVPADGRREPGQDLHIAAIGRPVLRSLERFPPLTLQAALKALAASTIDVSPPTPGAPKRSRGPAIDGPSRDKGPPLEPDFDIDF